MVIFLLSTFADELYIKGDYFRAIGEYKRGLFLGEDSINSMHMLALCYKNLGDYDKALYWYGRLNYINDKYINDYKYLLGLTLNLEDLKILIDEDEEGLNKIISKYENPSKKIYFSYIIPGSSQIIYGRFRDGVFSFMWNFLSAYVFYSRLKEKDYFGALSIFPIFIRFYLGNIDMAKSIEREDAYREFKRELNKYFGY